MRDSSVSRCRFYSEFGWFESPEVDYFFSIIKVLHNIIEAKKNTNKHIKTFKYENGCRDNKQKRGGTRNEKTVRVSNMLE